AEDGIRDWSVTGVQTCALPISLLWNALLDRPMGGVRFEWGFTTAVRVVALALVMLVLVWFALGWVGRWLGLGMKHPGFAPIVSRSEERRVGKEWGDGRGGGHEK